MPKVFGRDVGNAVRSWLEVSPTTSVGFNLVVIVYVGQNGNRHVCGETDRQSGRNLGVARIVASTWQVGVGKRGKGRE